LDAFTQSFALVEGSDLKSLAIEDLATLHPPIIGFAAKKLLKGIAELK